MSFEHHIKNIFHYFQRAFIEIFLKGKSPNLIWDNNLGSHTNFPVAKPLWIHSWCFIVFDHLISPVLTLKITSLLDLLEQKMLVRSISFGHMFITTSLSMNILCEGNKSPLQRDFFSNSAGNLLPALGLLSGLSSLCNFVIIFSLM